MSACVNVYICLNSSCLERQARDATADGLRDIDALLAMGEEDGKGGDEDDEEKKEGDENAEEQYEDDYEEEEELVDDNDYAQNYFDNGEGDDIDDDDGNYPNTEICKQ